MLDRSGSMDSCRDDTIGGFNAFVQDQKTLGGTLTLIQFDHMYTQVYDKIPIDEVAAMTRDTFVPRGATALLDAIGKMIKQVSETRKPIVAILTDGLENSSHEFTKSHIKDLIQQKTKEGWVFLYIGANQDAFSEAGSIGIAPGCSMNYDTNNTAGAFHTMSQAMSNI